MEFITENKWIILLIIEVLAWLSTFFMLYARYRLQSKQLFKLGTILTLMTGVVPQVTLGIINLITLKRVDAFTVVILLLILYGLTLGKRQIKRIDQWAKRKFGKQRDDSQLC
ncbi:MAG: hypothetical protein ACOX3R_15090 [Desulfitobacteriia bacterium]|jgi:hypothetical protein